MSAQATDIRGDITRLAVTLSSTPRARVRSGAAAAARRGDRLGLYKRRCARAAQRDAPINPSQEE